MSEKELKDPWQTLCESMINLKSVYDKLQSIMKEKQGDLIKNDVVSFGKLGEAEKDCVNEIEELENKRLLAVQLCIPDSEEIPTLKELLEKAPEESVEPLEKAAVGIMESLNGVASANRGVFELLNEAMSFCDFQLNLLGSDDMRETIYEDSGKMKGTKPKMPGIFNKKA